jgi:hypothetical protein
LLPPKVRRIVAPLSIRPFHPPSSIPFMTNGFTKGRFTDGPGGRRARRLALLTVLAFLAMLVAGSWYQLTQPTPPAQGAAATAPPTADAPAEPADAP